MRIILLLLLLLISCDNERSLEDIYGVWEYESKSEIIRFGLSSTKNTTSLTIGSPDENGKMMKIDPKANWKYKNNLLTIYEANDLEGKGVSFIYYELKVLKVTDKTIRVSHKDKEKKFKIRR